MPVLPDTRDAGWAVVGPGDDDSGSKIGNWSSLIGIITSIVGNILIALALNVQRYSHIQLGKRKAEARERAKEALRRAQNGGQNGYGATEHARTPHDGYVGEEDDVLESHPLSHSAQSGHSSWSGTTVEDDNKVSSSYLKSPSWWLGQILMTVGEMGNFLAYGFAPASIVSPLGVVALISNCVIAPIFFGEIFRARDFWGVVIAVGGAVTVVLSAKQEETKLDPHNVWDAISTMEFEIYVGVSVFLIIVLMWASPRYGNRSILIDLGLVGLFGGYTALSTKGVSSMLSSTLWRAFTTPVTYGLLVVLLGTAVMQVRYVNKALQRFDSTQVIPIQFVLFTLSVIIGSAILYRDFERTTVEQALKFIGGCLLTFFGVFLITSGRPQQHDDDELSDDDNVEETIGLRDQEASSMAHGAKPNEHVSAPVSKVSSRRSSRGSRVSFADASARPLITRHDSGVPSARKPEASAARGSLGPTESTSLLNNPWRNSVDDQAIHPGLGAPVFSDDSVVTIHSVTTTNTANTDPLPSGAVVAPSLVAPPPNAVGDRPVTPRPSFSSSRPHSRHYSKNSIISPSPLSSTVTAVVADALNRGDGNTLGRRRSIRRLQPSIRNSLFMPSDEDADEPLLESEPLIRPAATEPNLATAAADLDDARVGRGEQQGLRGRARSVSNTLGDLFSRTKKRRNTNPEVGSCGAGQPNPEDVTEGGSRVETGPPGDYGDRGERHHT